MTHTDYQTINAMRWYGGSFVRALAETAFCADPANLERLKAAFPEYWAKYAAMAKPKAVKEEA